jgi:peptidoglycan hydrolase-like protein with peptidoglycan-binding domain
VRDVQRAMAVSQPSLHLPITGVYDAATQNAVTAYQKAHKIKHHGIVAGTTWSALAAGKR